MSKLVTLTGSVYSTAGEGTPGLSFWLPAEHAADMYVGETLKVECGDKRYSGQIESLSTVPALRDGKLFQNIILAIDAS